MGTRHITAVVSEGQFVVAQYGQWDGYPTGAGNDIVAIIRGKIDQLKASLKHIVPVESDTVERYWTECGAQEWGADIETCRRFKAKHMTLDRDTGPGVLNILIHTTDPVELYLNVGFIADGLLCEWVYVVDLDSGMFEIYQGFQIHPSENRFSSMFEGAINGYYPPKLVATYPLDDLPTGPQLQRLERDCEQD